MNILFVTHHSLLYGANRSLLDLISGLQKYNVRSYVIAPAKGDFTEALEARCIEYDLLPVPSWVSSKPSSLSKKIFLVKKLHKALPLYTNKIKEWSIDIVHSNSSKSPIGRLAALKAGIPHIWHIREFLDLHFSYKFIFPRKLSLFFITTSRQVICISNALKEHFFRFKNENIHVLYDGVVSEHDFDKYRIFRQDYSESNEYKFAIVGALSLKKGQHSAIKAFADLKRQGYLAKLLIVGDGDNEYLTYCKHLVDQLNVSKEVIFVGYLDDPYKIFLNSDCLLVCSEFEAMGRVTIEAMSACLPVIARKSGGTCEIVVHNETGYLYESDNELVNYMARLVEKPAVGKRFGLCGWEYARERFTIEKYAESIYQIIRSI